MVIYITIFILLLFSLFNGKGKIVKRNAWFWYILLPLFLCTGYMVGSDWRNYELKYYALNYEDILQSEEPGYYYLALISKNIGIGFWGFSITIKLIGYYVFIYVFKRFSDNEGWGWLYLLANFGLFLWIDHPARNFTAVIISSISLIYFERGLILKFVLTSTLAFLFHFSALVTIPVFIIAYYVISRLKYNTCIIVIVPFFFITELIKNYLEQILAPLGLVSNMNSYLLLEDYSKSMSIARFAIILFFFFFFVLYIDNMRKKYRKSDFILRMSFIYAVLFCLGNINAIFFRFQYYAIIPFCVLISYLCQALLLRKRFLFRCFIIAFSFTFYVDLISRDYRYVPYSSYIEYLFENKPSYNFRDNFNKTHSPYK